MSQYVNHSMHISNIRYIIITPTFPGGLVIGFVDPTQEPALRYICVHNIMLFTECDTIKHVTHICKLILALWCTSCIMFAYTYSNTL